MRVFLFLHNSIKTSINYLWSREWVQTIFKAFCAFFGVNSELETIEMDGNYYSVVKKYHFFGNCYYMLINENDYSDLFFRKHIFEEDGEYLVGLDNEEELNRFLSSHVEEIESIWRQWWSDAPQLSLLFKK